MDNSYRNASLETLFSYMSARNYLGHRLSESQLRIRRAACRELSYRTGYDLFGVKYNINPQLLYRLVEHDKKARETSSRDCAKHAYSLIGTKSLGHNGLIEIAEEWPDFADYYAIVKDLGGYPTILSFLDWILG